MDLRFPGEIPGDLDGSPKVTGAGADVWVTPVLQAIN